MDDQLTGLRREDGQVPLIISVSDRVNDATP